jgi:uncharacterized membrane protein
MPVSSEASSDEPAPLAHEIAATSLKLRTDHKQETSALQQAVDGLTAVIGWPGFVLGLALVILAWIAGNLIAIRFGAQVPDPPPFVWLQSTMATGALVISALILTTQRREDRLAGHRLQLLLELAIVSDRKVAKVIALIEEVRRDNPAILDRVDGIADTMSEPSDAHLVLQAIKDVQAY